MLAVSVVAFHYGPIVGLRMMSGHAAVEVFFAISGFYMAMILTSKYGDQLGAFYINRLLRLYPTYLIVLLMGWAWFLVSWAVIGHIPASSWVDVYKTMEMWPKFLLVFSNWSMVGNDVMSLFKYSPHAGFTFTDFQEDSPRGLQSVGYYRTISQAWTLGMEIWFYLMAPWLLRAGCRVVLTLAICSLLVRFSLLHYVGGYSALLFFPSQFCWFALGMMLFALMQSRYFRAPTLGITLGLLLMAVFVICAWEWLPVLGQIPAQLFLTGMVPWLFAGTRRWQLMEYLGNWSYSIYLVHTLVAAVLAAAFQISGGTTIIILSSVIAWGISRYIEGPVDRWRHTFIRRQRASMVSQ